MTAPPDPAELAPTRDLAAYGARPLLSRGFWAAIVFGALCLAAAIVIVSFGPRLFAALPVRAAPIAPVASPSPAAYAPSQAPPPAATLDTTAPARVAALEARVQRLESNQARDLDAAAAALAAASLSEAAAQAGPFVGELAAFQRLLPASPDAQALAPLAAQGAPTRAALASDLANIAAKVSVAAKAPARDAGFMAQLAYAVSRVVSVRRVDGAGGGPDAALARAERLAGDGDLEGAAGVLGALPGAAGGPLEAWRERARRRIDIDRHIAGLRALAAADLSAARGAVS
ncbi:MAG: hypothetical protein ABI306_09285 [Caulobacteraceae bacterium]